MDPNAQKIKDACDADFNAHKSDCSGFVTAVAATLGIKLIGLADNIVDYITSGNGWTALPGAAAAKTYADNGWLVVGGLKSNELFQQPQAHGHVLVVVSDPTSTIAYPTAYWRQLGGIGAKDTTINYSFIKQDRDRVHYSAIQLPPAPVA